MRPGHSRRGFTLIEVLLVLAIIAVVSAIVLPSFVQSIRGNRLRTAARMVVMAGRYARSMAVLQQKEMAVSFDMATGGIQVTQQGAAPAPGGGLAAGHPSLDGKAAATNRVDAEAPPEHPPASGGGSGGTDIVRMLDRVKIERVEVEGAEEPVTGGRCSVMYETNGTCTPYKVRIVDEFGSGLTITVDALATAEIETEKP